MRADVVVIGSGPAGLSAARAAAAAGVQVVVVEEAPWAGGRLACRVDTLDSPPALAGRRADQAARELVAAAGAAGATIETGTLAWGLFPGAPGTVAVRRDGRVEAVEAGAVVVATGSLPAPYPFTGWTLPGVMTAPAVERLINRHGFLPGRQAVVVGDTSEAGRVARLLELCGAAVEQVQDIESAGGQGRVEEVTVGGQTRPADLVVLAVGRLPQVELLNAAGCPIGADGVPQHDPSTGRTPLVGVFVAGSAGGAGNLAMSIGSGAIAGISAAEHVGALTRAEAAARRWDLIRQLPPPARLSAPERPLPVDEFALVCRCEEIPRTEVEDAIRAGARTVDDVKRMTRCGMGFCQGKNCTRTVMNLLALRGAATRGQAGSGAAAPGGPLRPDRPGAVELRPMRLRPPVRPVRLGELAAAGRDVSLLERAIHPEGEEPHP
ncbi:FAD-dependent oxidoreductase [Caldinitratiruptor microaerophilus]|uniref:FAD/NAD(P)-binding oxidoreductase n=1 Tax=Caldinitratiruptor microaerophilus TaxID=671077 RepID=A0AA35CIE2_9FIRM|nr:FAD-dependent oxidoreductase [Caldinitratiruptor microaerophilus]BDG59542.1 FAD/NAD(P)-binding oxidoreductase [Caldinitratiruptor microaerophilus]